MNQHDAARVPAIRDAVFRTVTPVEAMRVLRTRWGKPWADAVAALAKEGTIHTDMESEDGEDDEPGEVRPKRVNDSLRGLALRVMILISEAPAHDPLFMGMIVNATGKQSSDVTPVVNRLIRKGWVQDEREDGSGEELARQPRRYLRATPAGRVRLGKARLSHVR